MTITSFFKELSSKIIIDYENNDYDNIVLCESFGNYFFYFSFKFTLINCLDFKLFRNVQYF